MINTRQIPTVPSSPGRIATAREYRDKFRQTVKNVLRRFVRDHYERNKGIICGIFLLITVARFVAGATKLGSDCEKERNVGTYLIVKATLGFIFWIAFLVLGVKGHMERALKNLFVEIYIYVDFLFAVVWFIVGMAWCFGNYRAMKLECPSFVIEWDFHFINFALFLTVSDLIIFCVFIFYTLYSVFDNEEE
ncbi:hypothetical protein DPMN_057665 [Dreissena polymorpha]|uniref:Uncharacterized protein n=1 Tax=Dreissena polymorpha TaxID=45954 RepID=A0A9D4HCF2_DREPO|nr:hypothetical protein DPMN_057665 [Dreissena polymorpha]